MNIFSRYLPVFKVVHYFDLEMIKNYFGIIYHLSWIKFFLTLIKLYLLVLTLDKVIRVGGENCVALCVTLVIVESREVVAQSSRALYMTAHRWLCD